MEMTEYAVQNNNVNHADAAKPTSIWIYGQLSELQSMHLSFACLTPIPETSGFAFIDSYRYAYSEQLIRVGRVQLAAMSSKTPTVTGNRVLHNHTVFAGFMAGREYICSRLTMRLFWI